MAYWCVCVGVYLSVYPFTIRKCFFSNMSWWIFVILGHNDHQVGDNRGVQEFGVKGHLGVIWGHCTNTLKTLLHLHDSIDFDETWVKRSVARGSFGVFRNFWSEVILGSLLEGQILNSLLQQIWLCQCVCLGQSSKSDHGDLFIRPVVKGSKVRKFQICFYEGSNVE